MDEPQIRFGDKLFLYGHLLDEEALQGQYNAVMGYMTVGGFKVWPEKTNVPNASIPGFVVDFVPPSSFAAEMPFYSGAVDVTGLLALGSPLPFGTKVWMPIP